MEPRRILQSALVLLLIALPVACGDDGDSADGSTTTSDASTTTTTTTATSDEGSSTSEAPSEQLSVWPLAGSSLTYDDPVQAATGFATELVGFTDPVVGEFQQGDSRSGEVEVRPSADGPVTTVMVRQLTGDDTWVVLAAATANIVPDQPEAGATVTSPLQLAGESTSFEATVQVTVIGADAGAPLARTFYTGGGAMGELAPFDTSVEFDTPDAATGAVLLWTDSAQDGRVLEVAALPVRFG